jgi:hypothetical protein
MGHDVSNEGKLGIDSIRLGGMAIDELPIAEGAITAAQMPAVREADRKNTVENIRAAYPKQSCAWVRGAIRECESTIKNVRGLKEDQQKMIDEYSGHISLCHFRDSEIERLDPEKDADEIKRLKIKFPPYNVKAMKQQITQCKEAIVRADIVIDKEHADISKLKELLTKCQQRDAELKKHGVTVD